MSTTTDAMVPSKAFRTLAAEFALAGSELHIVMDRDGAPCLQVGHSGKVVKLDSLDAARAHLENVR